ncbi:MAG: thioredoxin family protein [Theionarchaea archaeon]|nr:thioredoxin family protein [Theionarchaea archaeon]
MSKAARKKKPLKENKLVYLLVIIIILGALYIVVPGKQVEATSLEEGIRLARDQDKLIFLYINGEGCAYCRLLEQQFAQSEEFKNIIEENYIWVTLDFVQNPTIVNRFGLRGPPALIVLDENGATIMGIPGYPPNGVQDLLVMLKEALK